MLKYGMRGHDIAVHQPMETAFSKMETLGITRIQLAMDKTISDLDFSVGSYTPRKAQQIRESLLRHHIELPVLSCYINPADPDEWQRKQAVARFIETMRYAKVLGAGLVGTETGRASSDMSITPLTESEDCYQRVLKSFSEIAEEAESLNVQVGVEGVFSHTLSTPEKMDRFLREIGSSKFSVILDAANLIRPSLAGDSAAISRVIGEAFDRYGDRIQVLHIKDCIYTDAWTQKCTPPGEGIMDFSMLMQLVRKSERDFPAILEESTPARFSKDARFFERAYEMAGI